LIFTQGTECRSLSDSKTLLFTVGYALVAQKTVLALVMRWFTVAAVIDVGTSNEIFVLFRYGSCRAVRADEVTTKQKYATTRG